MVEPHQTRLNRAACRLAGAEVHALNDEAPIDRQVDRLTNPDVVQRPVAKIGYQRIDAVRAAGAGGAARHADSFMAAQTLLLGASDAAEEIDFLRLQRDGGGWRVGQRAKHDLIQIRSRSAKVVGVARQHDRVSALPFVETKRPGAHRTRVERVGQRIFALIQVARQDRRLDHVKPPQQRRVRLFETEDHRMRIGNVNGGEIRCQTCTRARVVLQQDFLERELHVGGGEWCAVVPAHILAQRERICLAAVADLPALGQLRNGIGTLVKAHQTVEDRRGDRVHRPAGRDRGIQMRRFVQRCHGEHAAATNLGRTLRRCEIRAPEQQGGDGQHEHG